MAKKVRSFSIARSTQALQDNVARAAPVAAASYSLVGAVILLGGLGYAVDRWQGTEPWGLLVGLLLGVAVGFYELVKMVNRG